MSLKVNPSSCMQEELVTITVEGLTPNEKITVSSHIKNYKNQDFFSYAYYQANKDGYVDLSKDDSLGGHFTGVFQMGLVAALQPAPHENCFLRHFKKNIEQPNIIDIKLHKEFLKPEDLFDENKKECDSVSHFRHFMAPGVKRIVIREGRVRGSLFIPEGEGPFPGMIDMFGTAGGLIETRAAQFAGKGIVAFSLAFFNYEDLPEKIETYEIAYFKEAVEILLKLNFVKKPNVGVLGVSKGGDLTLNMAVHIPEISAAICINGANYNLGNPLKISDDQTIPAMQMDMNKIKIMENGSISMKNAYVPSTSDEVCRIQLQKSKASILFVVGEDDQCMDSLGFAQNACQFMEERCKSNFKILSYPKAGHLMGPPYTSYCPVSLHSGRQIPIFWGGSLEEHTAAQMDAWIQCVEFLKTNI